MKIGIDGTPLSLSHPCGVKHYAEKLIEGLSETDRKNQYYIFVPGKYGKLKNANFHFIQLPKLVPLFKRQLFLGYFARKYKIDLFHYLEPFGSIFYSHPKIVTTIHDIDLDITYPKFRNIKYFLKRYYCAATRYFVIRKTKVFIFVSNSIKKEFYLKFSGVSKKSSGNIISEGVSKTLYKSKKNRNYGKYFLCMGDFSPRKNIKRIFLAYKKLPQKIKITYGLKVVSSTRESSENFTKLTRFLRIKNNTEILTSIDQKHLESLYSNAEAFLYPSLYEGFGLPILEAMSFGCPVITSNFGAMKETAGNAALFIDPTNVADIFTSMTRIIEVKGLRNKLIKKGLKRAKKFSWKNTARETIVKYEELYKETKDG